MDIYMVLEDARENLEYMKSARRFLHMYPGTGFDIKETFDFVFKELEKIGCNPKPCSIDKIDFTRIDSFFAC